MKLSRLLAALALIVAGLTAVPAAADDREPLPEPDRTLSQETLKGLCDLFMGTYVEDKLSYACELTDGATIECGDTCGYGVSERLYPPPLQEPCEVARGSYLETKFWHFACELREGVLTVSCPVEPEQGSVCDLGWVPSEQPMT